MIKYPYYKLMLVTNKGNRPLQDYLNFIALCAKSGITSVQLREKKLTFNELVEFGKELQALLKPLSIPLIVNDSVELALLLDAKGVHLGQSDGNIIEARQRLGSDKIIGLSVDSLEQLNTANTLPIDYIGIGAIFPTNSKENVNTLWGCDGLKQAALSTTLPIVAIGGIDESNMNQVLQAGANGIAAIGVFHNSKTPGNTIKNLKSIFHD